MRENYDRKYDMTESALFLRLGLGAATASGTTTCEGSDSNRHPLRDQILSLAGRPKASGPRGESEGSSATERHAATPNAAQSTTDRTTRGRRP